MLKVYIVRQLIIFVGVTVAVTAMNADHEVSDRVDFARESHHHHRVVVGSLRMRQSYMICRGSDMYFWTTAR